MTTIKDIEKKYMKEAAPSGFRIGDTVDVSLRIKEGDKERIQVFSGTVIARRSSGIQAVVTVRRIVAGEGIELTLPIHSPKVADIKVVRRGKVRRAKLYYLRDRVGKATRIKEDLKAMSEDRKREGKKTTKRAKAKAAPVEKSQAATEPAQA